MFWNVTVELLKSFVTTMEIFGLTLLCALPLGLIICFGSMSKFRPISGFFRFLVWVVRGTPLMLQLVVVYYVPGLVGQWAIAQQSSNAIIAWLATWSVFDRFLAVMIAFIINYACYFSEIYRGGIQSISVGQYEAGEVLGMSNRTIFFKVVLLQVIKRIVPPMSNEIITLVKDTSLARTISVYELIWTAQQFIKTDGLLWPLFYTAVFYLVFSGLLSLLFRKLEQRLDVWQ